MREKCLSLWNAFSEVIIVSANPEFGRINIIPLQPCQLPHVHQQHVAVTQWRLGSGLIKDNLGVATRWQAEGDATRHVCLYVAGNDVSRWPLCSKDQVNPYICPLAVILLMTRSNSSFSFLDRTATRSAYSSMMTTSDRIGVLRLLLL